MLQFYTTSDGSHTLLNTDLNETYHSRHGAIQESLHVFIKSGLHFAIKEFQGKTLHLLEVGFGTGLNALLTQMETTVPIQYTALEPFPLAWPIIEQLNYPSLLTNGKGSNIFHQLHQAPWDQPHIISPRFTLHKIKSELQKENLPEGYFDLLYYDAFGPARQPEMWEFQTLKLLAQAMKTGGCLVTYCAKGQLKRDLKVLGFVVETLPGAPGKAEMVRAKKTAP